MFLAHEPGLAPYEATSTNNAKNALWLDLLNPTPQELKLAEDFCGQSIPSPAKLHCIERSSQISVHNGAAFLSIPFLKEGKKHESTPTGFILTGRQVFTIRFCAHPAFDTVSRLIHQLPKQDRDTSKGKGHEKQHTLLHAGEVLVVLLEFLSDSLTTLLESTGEELNKISQIIFTPHLTTSRTSRRERAVLLEIGHIGNLCSRIRTALLGLERVTLFLGQSKKTATAIPVTGFALNTRHALESAYGLSSSDTRKEQDIDYTQTLSSPLRMRLCAVNKDISSLEAYLSELQSKDQFLLDATLGFISTEQNGVMKVLTVVTFIGMAPTLIAGIYGMNFKNMPELSWSFGYWYALSLMLFCVLLPLIWFWKIGWLRGIK